MGIGGCMLTWYTLAPVLMFIFFFSKVVKSCTNGRTLTVHEVVSRQDGKSLEVLSAYVLLITMLSACVLLISVSGVIRATRLLTELQRRQF